MYVHTFICPAEMAEMAEQQINKLWEQLKKKGNQLQKKKMTN